VLLCALVLRLVFAFLTAGTFDPDEFVVVALSRAVVHGAIPYRDIVFFHPPGMLALFAGLHWLVDWWWPSGRVVTLAIDSMTALFVWRIGKELLGDTEGLVAGLVYASSPIALVSAVRIGPDPVITALGVLGLLLLLTVRSRGGAVGAGLCLALAVWTKYTAILYLPVYLLALRSSGLANPNYSAGDGAAGLQIIRATASSAFCPRARPFLVTWLAATFCLFAPFLFEAHALFSQTVIWQLTHRAQTDLIHRLGSVSTYWLLLNPLAALALWRQRRPLWLPFGFCLGALFLLTAQAYYHYFVVIVPFAALLAAPMVTSLVRRAPRLLAACALSVSLLWAVDVAYGAPALRLHVTATPFSSVQQTAAILDRATQPNEAILTDHFEYALFAHRTLAANYFWNMSNVVRARSLEHRLPRLAAIVKTKGGRSYPPGFADYLEDRRFPRIQTASTVIWLIGSRS